MHALCGTMRMLPRLKNISSQSSSQAWIEKFPRLRIVWDSDNVSCATIHN